LTRLQFSGGREQLTATGHEVVPPKLTRRRSKVSQIKFKCLGGERPGSLTPHDARGETNLMPAAQNARLPPNSILTSRESSRATDQAGEAKSRPQTAENTATTKKIETAFKSREGIRPERTMSPPVRWMTSRLPLHFFGDGTLFGGIFRILPMFRRSATTDDFHAVFSSREYRPIGERRSVRIQRRFRSA
jgi:hypothetical protein